MGQSKHSKTAAMKDAPPESIKEESVGDMGQLVKHAAMKDAPTK